MSGSGGWNERMDRKDATPGDIVTAADAAKFMGVPPDSSDHEIQVAYRELVKELHPDIGGNAEAFRTLEFARDLLEEYPGGDINDAANYRAWQADAPFQPGTPGFRAQDENEMGRYVDKSVDTSGTTEAARDVSREAESGFNFNWGQFTGEQRERFNDIQTDVKVTLVETILNVDLSEYDSVEDAVDSGEITKGDIELVNEVLQERYDVSGIGLEEIGNIIAWLVMNGAMDLGNAGFFVGRSGAFGEGTGVFGDGGSGSFGGRGTGVFR